MKKLPWCLLFGILFLVVPWVFAQDSDQSSSDSGVLVSSPVGDTQDPSDQGISNGSGHHRHQQADSESDASSQNSTGNSNDVSNSSTDEIITKSTDAVMFQMIANLKMTQDQISAVRPIIEDNIVKVRTLQQSLESGTIEGKAMYAQKEQLTEDENQALSHILNPDQMRVWITIQEHY